MSELGGKRILNNIKKNKNKTHTKSNFANVIALPLNYDYVLLKKKKLSSGLLKLQDFAKNAT